MTSVMVIAQRSVVGFRGPREQFFVYKIVPVLRNKFGRVAFRPENTAMDAWLRPVRGVCGMTGKIRKGASPALPPDAQARIGAKLRQMYDSVVQEPVPDRFAVLLDRLAQSAPTEDNGMGEKTA